MCKGHIPELVRTTSKSGKVTMYCLKCEAEKDRLKRVIDSKIVFTHLLHPNGKFCVEID